METKHREILRNKRMVLCQGIDSQLIIKSLSASNILAKNDLDILKTKTTNLNKNEKLLDILPKRGSKAFDAFVEALKLNKKAFILGDQYVTSRTDEKENEVSDSKINTTMDEEKPSLKDKKEVDGIPPPPDVTDEMDEEFYDTVDVPVDDHETSKKNLDVDEDPGGKHAKIDEEMYDIVDTPHPLPPQTKPNTPANVHQPKKPLMINTGSTDFPSQDQTDAPPSASSQESEDGPFGRLGSQKPKDTRPTTSPKDSIDIVESSSLFTNHYQMKSNPRGHFLLINNKDFLPGSTMENYPRNGTDLDAMAMHKLFEELGYTVHSHRNVTCFEMKKEVKKIANMDHSKSSAVACCFLSHGKEGVLYGTDGEIEIRDLTVYFGDNKTLVNKPKMFFFQACQGSEYMDSIQRDGGMEVDGPGGEDYGNDISLPTEADFVYAYSTVPGYYSWRNSQNGSWFIQKFVETCRKYAHKMDLLRILTRVNQMVAENKSRTGVRISHNKRQIPSIVTQLRYELYLMPPNGPLKDYIK